MKHLLAGSLALALMAFSALSSFAEDIEVGGRHGVGGRATGHVSMTVNPNLTIGVNTANVNVGEIKSGPFFATLNFRVDANEEAVCLYVEASDLYKGDDPTNDEVAPIPLNTLCGALIEPSNANNILGTGNKASFCPTPTGEVQCFPVYQTEPICFESSQNAHFSQDVAVSLGWCLSDAEQPQGVYSGVVRLTAFIDQNSSVPTAD